MLSSKYGKLFAHMTIVLHFLGKNFADVFLLDKLSLCIKVTDCDIRSSIYVTTIQGLFVHGYHFQVERKCNGIFINNICNIV